MSPFMANIIGRLSWLNIMASLTSCRMVQSSGICFSNNPSLCKSQKRADARQLQLKSPWQIKGKCAAGNSCRLWDSNPQEARGWPEGKGLTGTLAILEHVYCDWELPKGCGALPFPSAQPCPAQCCWTSQLAPDASRTRGTPGEAQGRVGKKTTAW